MQLRSGLRPWLRWGASSCLSGHPAGFKSRGRFAPLVLLHQLQATVKRFENLLPDHLWDLSKTGDKISTIPQLTTGILCTVL